MNDLPMTNNRLLEARDLSVILGGRKVLDISSFEVRQNEILGIIGPNGSGKSTLILNLGLLLKPATGTLIFHGQPIDNHTQMLNIRRHFAIVFQEALLLDTTVWDNVILGLKLHRVKKGDAVKRTEKWLERFGIAPLANRQAKTLSGGEAKRASLARAFALQPEVLFLDEPFSALDTPTRQGLLEDFGKVLSETHMTTVMVTHDHNEVAALADRIAVLIEGKVRQTGSPQDIFNKPSDETVAGFIDTGNIIPGVVQSREDGLVKIKFEGDTTIQVISDLAPGTPVTVFLPYDDISISDVRDVPVINQSENYLKGIIVKVFPQGLQLKVSVDCGVIISGLISRRVWIDMNLEAGRQVAVSFKTSSPHLILKS